MSRLAFKPSGNGFRTKLFLLGFTCQLTVSYSIAQELLLNPVTEGADLQITAEGSEVEMRWWGGGHLQRSVDGTAWEIIATQSPFKSSYSGRSMYRVVDQWEGGRSVSVHVPASYDKDRPVPLFLLLHGFVQSADSFESYFQMKTLAERIGFLLVNPEGTRDSLNLPFWNAFDSCCDFEKSEVDDSGYLRAVIEGVCRKMNVDQKRIYIIGHSNGGFMAYQMACEHSERVAGIVSFAGGTSSEQGRCSPDHRVSVLHVHGLVDAVVPYLGPVLSFGVPFEGALSSVNSWADNNGVGPLTNDLFASLNLDLLLFGNDTLRTRSPGNGSGDVELWTILNGSHMPLLSPSSDGISTRLAETAVQWLLARPKLD